MDFIVLPLARTLRHVSPNTLTVIGLLFAFAAAGLILLADPASEATTFYLVFAGVFVFIHAILDMVDGVVARMFHKETKIGDFLDHVVDRVSDVALLAAVSFSPWGDLRVGLFAIVATLMTSYLGTQAQAVGAGRMYTGFVARADRLVLLIAAPIVDHLLVAGRIHIHVPGTPHVLGLVLWYIAIGGGITTIERFVRILHYLRRTAT